ncbi:uncharacterized protein LOC124912499 [Impatiens glandulifera]|uniref:uncharacterized protein LOC124912499 n=1 Tax=Impatiens glandulifera TaxID=253017 RepID=UPI001FB0D112|nr:uncharacterized protein LOC124912499 [Impatiens glandulifera]
MKMETRLQKMPKKKKSKRRIPFTSIPENADGNTIFALTLASIVRSSINGDTHSQKKLKLQDNTHSPFLIKKCLDRLLHCLLSPSPNHLILTAHLTLPSHIISLFPLLLTSGYTEIKSKSAEIVGAAALFSLEMNEQVASDLDILKTLMSALASPEKTIAIAACNAFLDLCTTSIGRQQLLKSSSLEHLV